MRETDNNRPEVANLAKPATQRFHRGAMGHVLQRSGVGAQILLADLRRLWQAPVALALPASARSAIDAFVGPDSAVIVGGASMHGAALAAPVLRAQRLLVRRGLVEVDLERDVEVAHDLVPLVLAGLDAGTIATNVTLG